MEGIFNQIIDVLSTYWAQVVGIISIPLVVTYALKTIYVLISTKAKTKSLAKINATLEKLPEDLEKVVIEKFKAEIEKTNKRVEALENSFSIFVETILSSEENAELKALYYKKLEESREIVVIPPKPETSENTQKIEESKEEDKSDNASIKPIE